MPSRTKLRGFYDDGVPTRHDLYMPRIDNAEQAVAISGAMSIGTMVPRYGTWIAQEGALEDLADRMKAINKKLMRDATIREQVRRMNSGDGFEHLEQNKRALLLPKERNDYRIELVECEDQFKLYQQESKALYKAADTPYLSTSAFSAYQKSVADSWSDLLEAVVENDSEESLHWDDDVDYYGQDEDDA